MSGSIRGYANRVLVWRSMAASASAGVATRAPCWSRRPGLPLKAPGPLRSFFLRIRARRGHQVAAVAVARKLAVVCWHLLSKNADYHWARPALLAHKVRAMELQAGLPEKKGNKRGPAYAYNVKELRDREIEVAL